MTDARKLPSPPSGVIASYIHAGSSIGVLVELRCESDFVARTEEFQALAHDIAMHIAALDRKYVRKEDIPSEALDREREIYRAQAATTGKPPAVIDKIVEGKIGEFYDDVCLYEQRFTKEETTTIAQLIAATARKLGESISVFRFARFKVGDVGSTVQSAKLEPPSEGDDEAGVAVRKPRHPNKGSGSATVDPRTQTE